MDAGTCIIDPDADIIGIGIRLSIYILSISSPIIRFFGRSSSLSSSIDSSLGVTGLALLLTTIIKTSLNDLALFHAICVLHLLGLVGLSIRPKGRYPSSAVRTGTFMMLYVFAITAAMGYFIYVFATAPGFGARPECNDGTNYVLFGVNVRATNKVVRWIFVAIFAMLAVGFVAWLLSMTGMLCCIALDCCCFKGGRNRPQISNDVESGSGHGFGFDSEDKTKLWNELIVMLGQLGACVYMIATLELIIIRNDLLSGLGEWEFGQLLAMMMLLGPLIELMALALGRFKTGT